MSNENHAHRLVTERQASIEREIARAIEEDILPITWKHESLDPSNARPRRARVRRHSDNISHDQARLLVLEGMESRPRSFNGTTITSDQPNKKRNKLYHLRDVPHRTIIDHGHASLSTHSREANSVFSNGFNHSGESTTKTGDDDHEDFVRVSRNGSHTYEKSASSVVAMPQRTSVIISQNATTSIIHERGNERPKKTTSTTQAQKKVYKNWDKVKHLRNDVFTMRSRVQELRGLVREKRMARYKADDKFFQYIRKLREKAEDEDAEGKQPGQILDGLFLDCETIRDECGPLEDEYESLENDLGIKEFALQKLETKFYENSEAVQHEDMMDARSTHSSSDSGSQISHDLHPLVSEYLSKLGDVDISRERLEWHLDEKQNLEEEKMRRQRVGLDLAAPDQEWLLNYEIEKQEIEAQLSIDLKEAERLRSRCYSLGLVDEEGEPTDFEEREQRTFGAELELGKEPSGYVKYPTLLPPPSGLQIKLQDSSPSDHPLQTKESIDPRLRVDQWLLHQLRMSSLGVNLLAETFKAETGGTMEADHWQQNVLNQWYKDEAVAWKPAPRTASSRISSRTSNHTVLQNFLQGSGSYL